jgi:FtsP/CotA-like multicopper oxidase with cupredoxin domain
MSGGQRAVLIIVAAVIAVGAFLVLKPADEDSSDSAERTTQPATTQTEPEVTTPTETQPEARQKEPEVETIRVRGGRPVGGVQTIEATKGEAVRFRVTTETPQEVHLHGYDLTENSTAERPAEFRFRADETGIFELEIHGTHTQIGELKVEP